MTLYHRSVDYWVTIKLLFEYSIEGAVVLSNKKIEPFQLVELSSGNNVEFFVLDVIRIIISILIAALCTALPIYNMRQQRALNRKDLSVAVFEIFVMCIFIVQLFYLSSNQSSAQLLTDKSQVPVEYQRAYTKRYVDVVVVFLQIYILIRFAQLDEYIAIMLHGMKLILPNILVFTVFWWIFIGFFA
jgi:hypothetical protein